MTDFAGWNVFIIEHDGVLTEVQWRVEKRSKMLIAQSGTTTAVMSFTGQRDPRQAAEQLIVSSLKKADHAQHVTRGRESLTRENES